MAKATGQGKNRTKRVLIGTPALDGRVDAWFCYALHELGKQGLKSNIEFKLVMLSYESILPMARNEILTLAINENVDALVFIDSDVYCDAQALINVVKANKDVVCIPTVKKNDQESYDIFFNELPTKVEEWIKADGVSTSCLYLSKKALTSLGQNSTQTIFRGKTLKNVCQYDFQGERFMGEDIYLCEKLKALGFEIWINTSSTCTHTGPKVYKGDFKAALQNANQSK